MHEMWFSVLLYSPFPYETKNLRRKGKEGRKGEKIRRNEETGINHRTRETESIIFSRIIIPNSDIGLTSPPVKCQPQLFEWDSQYSS